MCVCVCVFRFLRLYMYIHIMQITQIIYHLFSRALLQKNIVYSHYANNSNCINRGWRRPIGCLKFQVIFRKGATNYRALLQKMTYEDKASYDSTPLCNIYVHICIFLRMYTYMYMYVHSRVWIVLNPSPVHVYVQYAMT